MIPRRLQRIQPLPRLIPIWMRSIIASVGLAVATIRSMQESKPSFDPSKVLDDYARLEYIHAILSRMGVPPELAERVTIVTGEHNGLQGSYRRFVSFSEL